MYTEIVKIIEGSLANDKEKVVNYAKVLAGNLETQGDFVLAKKIRYTIDNKKGTLTSLDSFSTRPVDAESRMDIVEISSPNIDSNKIVLDKYSQEEILKFIERYNQREALLKAGVESTNSLLLYGPPGCGKTTVAEYISTITGLPLVTAKLDGLVSSLLGSTAKNIRKIFDYASRRECILFLDEFDVIAKLRDDKNELGELKRVVNSLIQNIDSFSNGSILIAATNHHELLDPAIWRRFNTVISLEKPEKEEIGKLLNIFLEDKNAKFLINAKKLETLENVLLGLSHSDIKSITFNVIRDSILMKKKQITYSDFLREVYFHKNHAIESEEILIEFLINNGATHKEMNLDLDIPLRKIQEVSSLINKRED